MDFNKNQNAMIDYYEVYGEHINIDQPRKEIYKTLNNMLKTQKRHLQISEQNADESMIEKINYEIDLLHEAIKIFRKDDNREKYDKALEKARKDGNINHLEQKKAKDILEEIHRLFSQQLYPAVVNKCTEAFNEGTHISELYRLMSLSYFELGKGSDSIKAINDGLIHNPDDKNLLYTGAELAFQISDDTSISQGYINRILEISPNDPQALAKQCFLYMYNNKQDLSYKKIDEYLECYPDDQVFRRACAYNLVRYVSFSMFTTDEYGNSYVSNKEAYDNGFNACSKALELYRDDGIARTYEDVKSLGETSYNNENTSHIIYLILGGIVYLVFGILLFLAGLSSLGPIMFIISTILEGLGIGLMYSGYMLRKESYRPQWQIDKYDMTGIREPSEEKYINIGNKFVSFMKFTFKAGMFITKIYLAVLAFILALMVSDRRNKS